MKTLATLTLIAIVSLEPTLINRAVGQDLLTRSNSGAVVMAKGSDPEIRQAEDAFARLNTDEAARRYEEVARESDDFSVRYRWAELLLEVASDRLAEGSGDARDAVDHVLDVAEALVERNPERAEAWFALAAAKGNAAAVARGRKKIRLGGELAEFGTKALEIDPDFVPAHVAMGMYYRQVAELSRTKRALARALFGSIPSNAKGKALTHLRHAVSLEPTSIVANYQLGKTQKIAGEDPTRAFEIVVAGTPVGTREHRNHAAASAFLQANADN